MRKLFIFALLCAGHVIACSSGFQQITDPFLNPDGSAWTGSITDITGSGNGAVFTVWYMVWSAN